MPNVQYVHYSNILILLSEEDSDEIKIGTSCKNSACNKVGEHVFKQVAKCTESCPMSPSRCELFIALYYTYYTIPITLEPN